MIDLDFKEKVKTCDEIDLYLIINSLGGNLFYIRHDLADGRIESTPELEQWLIDAQEQIEYAVDQTTRFGVSKSRDEHKVATPEYWKWFRRWDAKWTELDEKTKNEIMSKFQGA